nr:hypothetical protein [Marinicella sp. W31]MDC2876176.1 hypothetical protein [Marinicella sp. W31]
MIAATGPKLATLSLPGRPEQLDSGSTHPGDQPDLVSSDTLIKRSNFVVKKLVGAQFFAEG